MVMNPSARGATQFVTKHTLLEAAQGRGGRLLVADDNMVNQKVAVRMLEKVGYRVDVVANGLEAVEAVSRITYHAVLMDCQMPEMDGYEATQEIRRREALNVTGAATLGTDEIRDARYEWRLPIIAMTANAMQGDREKCLDAGMDDFVSKPVKPEELEAVLDRWVPKQETETREAENREAPVGNNEIQDTRYERRNTSDDPQGPPLDLATLEGLRGLSGDDPSFLLEVIQIFLQDGPGQLASIQQAVADASADALMKAAHSFKGSCWNMGALLLGELCLTLEQKGRAGETENLEDLLNALDSEYSRVRIALEAELAALPSASI